MDKYIEKIQSVQLLSIDIVQDICKSLLPNEPKDCKNKPWRYTSRGIAIYEEDFQCNCYMAAYAQWHKGKLQIAFEGLPAEFLTGEIDVIDWACGQGIGVTYLAEYIRNKKLNCKIREVILIEPSQIARERAFANICHISPSTKITEVAKKLNDVVETAIKFEFPRNTLNIFSNIIDVDGIDLKHLSSLLSINSSIDNYISVVGPYLEPRRVQAFFNYFRLPYDNYFAKEKTNKESQSDYTYIIRQLCLRANRPEQIIHYKYFPATEFRAAYSLDAIYDSIKDCDHILRAYKKLSHFEVYAPFDLGASVYDDIHPIYAVLHNIISRGMPTKASPYVEQVMSTAFKQTTPNEEYGSISYESNFSTTIHSEIENILLNRGISKTGMIEQLIYTPIAIARFQKLLIEILITGRLKLSDKEWNLLVIENDVPFAKIAMDDFREMFEHLTALSSEFHSLHLPTINLTIVSNAKYSHSPLQEIDVADTVLPQHKSKLYDFVLNYSSRTNHSAAEIEFSQFKLKKDCYFVIFSKVVGNQDRTIYTTQTLSYLPLVEKDALGNYTEIETNVIHLRYFLKLLFRKCDFRPGQLPILSRAITNKSVIGLLPTGGGKSLTYQLAAMLQPGVTLIIDPLTSLMKDQYDGLRKVQIDCCTYINSTVSTLQRGERETAMEKSMMLFVFLSPERLAIFKFRQRLKNMQDLHVYFSYGVIDEVHCVSEWGHDFRYSYLHLGRNLYQYVLPKQIPGQEKQHLSLFGLTATASFDVLSDVERELTGNGAFPLDPDAIIRYENTNRLELQYRVIAVDGKMCPSKWDVYKKKNNMTSDIIQTINKDLSILQKPENIQRIKERFIERENIQDPDTIAAIQSTDLTIDVPNNWYVSRLNIASAIVFCPHRQGSLGVSDTSNNQGVATSIQNTLSNLVLKPDRRFVSQFCGGDDLSNQDEFLQGNTSIMVATKAFGMGIDKPNVRFTLNVNHSGSLEAFVQEAGRAGRDRKMALATILFCNKKFTEQDPNTRLLFQQPVDFGVHQFFYNGNFIGADFEKWVMFYLMSHNTSTTYVVGENEQISVSGFIGTMLASEEGRHCVYYISYDSAMVDLMWINNQLQKKQLPILCTDAKQVNLQPKAAYYVDAISKAIYRMCCIGVIDDYTQDYVNHQFRIVAIRKKDGEYYKCLKSFLMRYFTEERAELEMQKAHDYQGANEIQKCLGYLTEFVYSKIASKRYRAIQDMEDFCSDAISQSGSWLEINEHLKDYIYYYFNSKFAKEGYITDSGSPYSLTDDSDKGKKSSWEILFKYLNVVDDMVIGASGSPKDNIKHLQGAVRLIRRSLTDSNPTLDLLNVYCLLFLGVGDNTNLQEELKTSYLDGYLEFKRREQEPIVFFARIKDYKNQLVAKNAANNSNIEMLNIWDEEAEFIYHSQWTNNFVTKFT